MTGCFLALATYLVGSLFLPLAYPRYLWILVGLALSTSLPVDAGASRRIPLGTDRDLTVPSHPLTGGGRLRVLHVIDSLLLGGAEQLLVTLAETVDRGRIDLRVCSLCPVDDQAPIPVRLQARGVPVYSPVGMRRHDPRHVLWLSKLIRREHIDVVHTHLSYGNIVGLQAAASARRPAVSTIHSIQDRYSSLAFLKEPLQARALRRHARIVIACSSEVGQTTTRRFRVPAQRLCVVPNGIDTAVFGSDHRTKPVAHRRMLLGDHVGPLVVAVGNMSRPKSHETLVDAAAQVIDHFPGLCVVIVGRAADNLQRVRDHIMSQRLEDRVILRGERTDVPSTLAAADLFVDSSRSHGLPLAILEAMAAAVPVVATAVGEIPRLREDGGLIDVVPPADAVALAGAMTDLLRDRSRARAMATSARSYVQERHDASTWVHRLEAIYIQVMDEPVLEPLPSH